MILDMSFKKLLRNPRSVITSIVIKISFPKNQTSEQNPSLCQANIPKRPVDRINWWLSLFNVIQNYLWYTVIRDLSQQIQPVLLFPYQFWKSDCEPSLTFFHHTSREKSILKMQILKFTFEAAFCYFKKMLVILFRENWF